MQSPTAWDGASLLGAVWLCRRRGNKVPKSLAEWRDEVLADLKDVQAGRLSIEDCAQRQSSLPTISNVIEDPTYRGKKSACSEARATGHRGSRCRR